MSTNVVSSSCLDMFMGMSFGNESELVRKSAREIDQGKSFYLSAFPKWIQISVLTNIVEELGCTSSPFIQGAVAVSMVFVRLLSLPGVLLLTSVKEGHYNMVAKEINKGLTLMEWPAFFPEELSEETQRVCSFLVESGPMIVQGLTLVTAVALAVFVNPYFGFACLGALAYGILDQSGCIERRVSLFIETYLPIVSLGFLIYGGDMILRTTSIIQLPFYIFSNFIEATEVQIDWIAKQYFGVEGPSLQDLNAPWVEKKGLSFEEIKEILEGEDSDYEVNVSHCNKDILGEMESSNEFKSLLSMVDAVKWEKKLPSIRLKFQDDERFIDEVITILRDDASFLPELRESLLAGFNNTDKFVFMRKHSDKCIKALAKRANCSEEAYLISKFKKQITNCVSIVNGDLGTRVVGNQRDLADAIEQLKYVVPYLKELQAFIDAKQLFEDKKVTRASIEVIESVLQADGDKYKKVLAYIRRLKVDASKNDWLKELTEKARKSQVSLEDLLLKLGIEGVDYCALGIKRAVREMLDCALFNASPEKLQTPVQRYEFGIKRALQEKRLEVLTSVYKLVMDTLKEVGSNPVSWIIKGNSEDIHLFDIYRQYLAFGFYPMTFYEKREFGLPNFLAWELSFRPLHELCFKLYEKGSEVVLNGFGKLSISPMNDIFINAGGCIGAVGYVQSLVKEEGKLSEEEQDLLTNYFSTGSLDGTDHWGDPEKIQKDIERLIFVKLGILKKKGV